MLVNRSTEATRLPASCSHLMTFNADPMMTSLGERVSGGIITGYGPHIPVSPQSFFSSVAWSLRGCAVRGGPGGNAAFDLSMFGTSFWSARRVTCTLCLHKTRKVLRGCTCMGRRRAVQTCPCWTGDGTRSWPSLAEVLGSQDHAVAAEFCFSGRATGPIPVHPPRCTSILIDLV